MSDRYEKIRQALAMGPTPGPFNASRSYSPGNQELILRLTYKDEHGIAENYCTVRNRLGDTWKTEANAAYIAACDPDTIRELLAERDRLAAALEAAREDGWQPIETAPNEAWLLVHSERGWIGLARRSDPDYAPDEGWFEDEHTEFIDPAWLTHWRPLPAPPADAQRAKEE